MIHRRLFLEINHYEKNAKNAHFSVTVNQTISLSSLSAVLTVSTIRQKIMKKKKKKEKNQQ